MKMSVQCFLFSSLPWIYFTSTGLDHPKHLVSHYKMEESAVVQSQSVRIVTRLNSESSYIYFIINPLQAVDCEELAITTTTTTTTTPATTPTTTAPPNPNYSVCKYECKSSGGCKVIYTGAPRPGSTEGSCLPCSGTCTGIPAECIDCNHLDCSGTALQ